MLPKLIQFFETIVVTEILTGHLKKQSDNSNRKTRVRFVYVLPNILHGDFFYEIKYLVNPE